MFKFEIHESKKLVQATVKGFFKKEEAVQYIAEYQQTVKKISPSGYTLLVDTAEQNTVTKDIFDDMQQAVDLYLSSRFKKVIVVLPKSATASIQVKRLNGHEKITFVSDLNEALSLV